MPGFRLRRRRDRAATAHLAYPVLDGLAGRGCAFCRHEARREGDAAWSFLYEGKHASEVRAGLRAAGGFCGRHADLVLQTALRHDLTAGLAEVYEHLIAADVAGLRGGGRRWRSAPAPCPLCLRRAEAEARMARFVGERLGADAAARAAYLESDGFCLPHLRMVMPHVDPATAEALADDAQRRLGTLGGRLSEYRRKRDYRNAAEPRGDEQRSAIDATWRYARRPHADAGRGEPPDAG